MVLLLNCYIVVISDKAIWAIKCVFLLYFSHFLSKPLDFFFFFFCYTDLFQERVTSTREDNEELIMGIIGALICWFGSLLERFLCGRSKRRHQVVAVIPNRSFDTAKSLGSFENPCTWQNSTKFQRQFQFCYCDSCGRVARCVPSFDFYGGQGEPLVCETCFSATCRAKGWNTEDFHKPPRGMPTA